MENYPYQGKIESFFNANSLCQKLNKNSNIIAFSVMSLLVISVLYTLYFARVVILPIVIAVLLNFLFSPIIRLLKKIWIPQSLGALLIILVLFSSIFFGFYRLSGPTGQWLANAPNNFIAAQQNLTKLLLPINESVKNFFKIKAQIETSTSNTTEKNVQVVPEHHKWIGVIFTNTWEFFIQLALVTILLYFLLASSDFFLRKLVELVPKLAEKKEAVIIFREIEKKIFSFLFVKVLTCAGLAVVISFAMFLLKMPHPIVWGVLAGIVEFIPYIGVLIGTAIITFSALLTFDTLTHVLLVALVFFSICSIEGNIVFPLILSRNLILHPVIVFVGVIFWSWIWGIAGTLIAIPLMSIVKIFFDNIKTLTPYGKFLSEE